MAIDKEVAKLEQKLAEIEQEQAELVRKKTAFGSAIEGLKEARGRLVALPELGGSAAAPNQKATATVKPPPVVAKPPQESNSKTIADFLKSAGAPRTIFEIAEGTGLKEESVRRV